jgi:hypothetical protein
MLPLQHTAKSCDERELSAAGGRRREYMANSNHFVDMVPGGWQLQTIIVLRSGAPHAPIVSTDVANTGVGSQRPNLNPAGKLPTFHKSLSTWFEDRLCRRAGVNLWTGKGLYTAVRRIPPIRCIESSRTSPCRVVRTVFPSGVFNLPNTTSFNAPSSTIDATTCF